MKIFNYFVILLFCLMHGESLQLHCYNCTCIEIPPDQLVVNCSSLGLFQVPESLPRNLTSLDLSYNNINYIKADYFEVFTHIRRLNISDNPTLGLKNASTSFHGLRNSPINVLNVSGVVKSNIGCVQMKKDFFTHLKSTKLKAIYLDRNRILTIEPRTLNSVPTSLQIFSLRKTRLVIAADICKQFLTLTSVITLDISHLNREAHLTDILSNFQLMKAPQRRKRSTYPTGASGKDITIPVPPKLEKLSAKDCNFKTDIPESVTIKFTSNNLKVLDLSRYKIGKVDGIIRGVDTLEKLDFSGNACRHISVKIFRYMPKLKTLILRSNNLDFRTIKLAKGSFKYLQTLDMSSNRIHRTYKNTFDGFPALKKLILSGNIIYNFNVRILHMSSLSVLDLSHNQINYLTRYITKQLDTMAAKNSNFSVNLTGNPLICSCRNIFFIRWVLTTRVELEKHNLFCYFENDRSKKESVVSKGGLLESQCRSHIGIAMGGLVAVTGSLFIIIIGIVYRFRWKLRYLYYVVRGKYRSNQAAQEDGDFDYDAFISYAEEDADFVVTTFIEKIEIDGQLRLCLHQRDFRPGASVATNILSAIQKSRHVVIVLSPNFLYSYWCRWEFEMARMEGLYTERNVVVLVRYQEVIPSVVPRDMLYMMHTHTYLAYPDDQEDQVTFWTALRRAIEDN